MQGEPNNYKPFKQWEQTPTGYYIVPAATLDIKTRADQDGELPDGAKSDTMKIGDVLAEIEPCRFKARIPRRNISGTDPTDCLFGTQRRKDAEILYWNTETQRHRGI